MMNTQQTKDFDIIGAGLSGSLLSIYLAKKGYSVNLWEKRSDLRNNDISAGRSINLAISTRGLSALKEIGLEEKILNLSIPMRGRFIHHLDGHTSFSPYGRHPDECIFALSRGELNKVLLNETEKFPTNVISFNKSPEDINFNQQQIIFDDNTTVSFNHLIGCDGAGSVVRQKLIDQWPKGIYHKEILSHSYKELIIPASTSGDHQIEKEALHIWPRKSYMLIALPNLDGSFTCTLFLTTHSEKLDIVSFNQIKNENDLINFFKDQFPDALELMPNLVKDYFNNPTGQLATVRCSQWYESDKALLVGDSAHAIVPFFGQGMNCCFEDCSVFNQMIPKKANNQVVNFDHLFKEFTIQRITQTNAIADMAIENFLEMRDHSGNENFLYRKKIEQQLMKLFPSKYISRYNLVTFEQVPYAYAQACGKIQEKLIKDFCQKLGGEIPTDPNIYQDFIEHYSKQIAQL